MSRTRQEKTAWEKARDEEIDPVPQAPKPPVQRTETRTKKGLTFRPPDYGDRYPVDPIQHSGYNVAHDF